MKIVTIDFGNSSGKLAVFEHGKLLENFKGDAEEVLNFIKKVNADAHCICSVAHAKEDLEALFEPIPNTLILQAETDLPIQNAYATPHTLGMDRLAAAIGTLAFFPNENCLIIDLGTAIKYDYIDKQATFKGGIISPGMQMRFRALHTFTQKLPLIQAEEIPELVGTSTETCIRSGVVNGIIAEINGIIARYEKQGELKILLTGGDADFFESQINYPTFATQNLVHFGLYRILIHNVENKSFTL
ncbi:type III pantothenate kinase [Marinilongibacter aquaticus]|uniref:type III pantothenate kinase n=1 Tax=Marinilongibacter aquaticus TaxID=2975157 RepID=UPI0021BD46D7|nr:type III pantothenate kinase [Marinilongibacter aquaticus]UBM58874.1 type III pantothenate kinase [Marinilongibacter aquaticus]